jgi:hypothetical protein
MLDNPDLTAAAKAVEENAPSDRALAYPTEANPYN